MTKEQIMRRLNCTERYAQHMIDWASNELELRVLVAQKDHELQTRKERGIVELNQIVATNIRVFMSIKDVTSTEISDQLKMSKTTITSLTNGKFKGIQNETITKIADFLEVEPFELFMPVDRFKYRKGE